jgi:putative transposase
MYILPFGAILAWCLMPNHFHLMVLVKENCLSKTHTESRRTINESIAILLRSYTRAINKQENRTGALFREGTKAECINCFQGVKLSFIQTDISLSNLLTEKQYPQVCFDYIHQNPVKAKLVKNAIDWEFSSARDYACLRNGKLVNKLVAGRFVDIFT